MALRSTSTLAYAYTPSAVVPVPSGATTSDIIVIDLYLDHGGATVTPPSGFTLETTASVTGSPDGTLYVYRYWKRLTAVDTGSYTFSLSVARNAMAVATAWSGRITSGSPFDTGTGASATTSSPAASNLSISIASTTAGADIILGVSIYNDAGAPTATGFTQANSTDPGGEYILYESNQATGSPGSVTAALTSTDFCILLLSALLPTATPASTVGMPWMAFTNH